ncbi:DNA ligase D [Evansella cellulosilytica]|uniref:DNA polymerase LigD, polymerase domain protein n=1 Tax=Evansella cellulosilytica (strain ATCC 21833 / DSM 2522 / FERM P-1141 / JCM 9156 / N-4) TaxID=649639 RepID=E6U0J1_EVAC2|nr:DNA ligase D [Evansella cellulosilytica]ADU31436.1 DNA polymerase LigD, polymerase domain protein [Evansella cellulosilytica DSM 2522]
MITLNSFSKKMNYVGYFFITGMNNKTNEFTCGLLINQEVLQIGSFSDGMSEEEKKALTEIVRKNKSSIKGSFIHIEPGIVVELTFKGIISDKLTNPVFQQFRTDLSWTVCTKGQLILLNKNVKKEVTITNPDKPLWQSPVIVKDQYICYLHDISPFMLPFLHDRILTVRRYPHGVSGEVFYQKNCPEYAPPFIRTHMEDDINYIVCENLSSLLWLGNQLALEFHIPFQLLHDNYPREIVFDLDPPSREDFSLAVVAAMEMKKLFDKFNIISFPKLSGNKGLQVHVPLATSPISYEDTRVFTSFIAHYLVETQPDLFTVERMKKNRGNRLYIDYVQHWHGKTIIAPYSTRGREGATVAAPLFWKEVDENLNPDDYHLFSVLERVRTVGCPFAHYFEEKNEDLLEVIDSLKNKQD